MKKRPSGRGPEGFGADLTPMMPAEVIHFGGSVYQLTIASINLLNAQPQVLSSTQDKNWFISCTWGLGNLNWAHLGPFFPTCLSSPFNELDI